MKQKVKELIDELIDYRKNRKPIKYLNVAYNGMGDKEFVQLIGFIFQWQKESALNIGEWKDIQQFPLEEVLFPRYTQFFKECPELKEVWKLNKENISWADDITEEEKLEIRDYIHTNYKIQFRARIKRPKM
ncbi:hypothetical protein [Mesoflavibacter zeaxanthinifaciens]|uniref:hypothetical protein n=1 Tax=Mesoflavibacter zeaxanthinifaciens TaxID=393060 RepID=UPI003A95ADBA